MTTTIAGTVHQTVQRLDPNMLAVLAMVIILNGLFFWALRINADYQHLEFLAALNACPANRLTEPINSPRGMDR
jgi:hypothetical protein